MFVAIYYFEIIPGKKEQFISAWTELTKFIYKNEGSLGSRLHQKSTNEFIAYAQWPSKAQWENAGKNRPPDIKTIRNAMRASCSDVKTLHELETTVDLLMNQPA